MRRQFIIMSAALLAGAAAASIACGDGSSGDSTGAGAPDVTIVAKDTLFAPENVTVPAGREVTLQLDNRDPFDHDLQVDDIEVDVVDGGSSRPEHGGEHGGGGDVLAVHTAGDETAAITFMAEEPGTYEFYCTLPGHKDSGMVGTITVE